MGVGIGNAVLCCVVVGNDVGGQAQRVITPARRCAVEEGGGDSRIVLGLGIGEFWG